MMVAAEYCARNFFPGVAFVVAVPATVTWPEPVWTRSILCPVVSPIPVLTLRVMAVELLLRRRIFPVSPEVRA
jgi:hypothetical protein